MTTDKKLYIVLNSGEALLFGRLIPLPLPVWNGSTYEPGEWILEAPSTMSHLVTSEPVHHYGAPRGFDVYEVGQQIVDGVRMPLPLTTNGWFTRYRLLRKVINVLELEQLNILVRGRYEVSNGTYKAYGKTKIKASGDAIVYANDKVKVVARDRAVIHTREDSKVKAYGMTTVCVHGRSKATVDDDTIVHKDEGSSATIKQRKKKSNCTCKNSQQCKKKTCLTLGFAETFPVHHPPSMGVETEFLTCEQKIENQRRLMFDQIMGRHTTDLIEYSIPIPTVSVEGCEKFWGVECETMPTDQPW